MRLPLAFTLLALLGACSVPDAPHWSVNGGFLRDPDGRAAILRGINVANAHKHPPYFGFHQPEDLQRIRDAWGMNSVRLLTEWAAIEPEKGVYDEDYLDALALRATWAKDAGLLIVVDMHQDLYGEGFDGNGAPRWTCDEKYYQAFVPRTPWFLSSVDPNLQACVQQFYESAELKEHFTEAWRRVAVRLKEVPAVIGFEVLNEPIWGTGSPFAFENDLLLPLYEKVVPAVRDVCPHWLAFLEPSVNVNLGAGTELTALPFANVAFAPHSYDSKAESGEGFDPKRRDAIFSHFSVLSSAARDLGAALWVGEYGGLQHAPGIGEYMDAQYDAAGSVAASMMYWSYDKGGYSPIDGDGNEVKTLVDILVRPYPERVAGEPLSYSWDETTSTFTLAYRPDSSVRAPTELAVPTRVYPRGYQADCGGCTVRQEPGRLLVLSPPAGPTATVTLRP